MDTKPLLYGLIGFFIGGLLVSVAATTFDRPADQNGAGTSQSGSMTMADMTASLAGKTGDAYDKEFIGSMIEHHQSAVDMARLSAQRANHDEIKQLSGEIIAAQEREIGEMRAWQRAWGYESPDDGHPAH